MWTTFLRLLVALSIVLVAFGVLVSSILFKVAGIPIVAFLIGFVLVAVPTALVYDELWP